ncbi:peptide chain release factor 1 [Candidatus Dojkabacteria bacterium]|nr:peptide chain release factor 1 [Candidatus Dojkabacteria bacterium]
MDINKLKTQVKTLQEEIKTLEKESSSPDTIKDISKLKDISQNIASKQEKLSILIQLLNVKEQVKETEKMIQEETDEEMLELVKDENSKLKEREMELQEEIAKDGTKIQEAKECIVEIRPGTGGEEANLFALDLFRMYSKYAESRKWQVQILSKSQTGKGGLKELIAQISGEGCFEALQYESGVHRVQRIPVTESSGRIHTSAASVVVYPLIDEKEIHINPQDLKIDVYRSTGPGGQSVNTTDSAVRMTHIPTGIVVTCQDEKSQHKNKKKALSILASRLADAEHEKKQEELSEIRKSAIKTGDRSAKIRTYNFPQSRVTDHRIKKSWHNLKDILEGNLDQIIETLSSVS